MRVLLPWTALMLWVGCSAQPVCKVTDPQVLILGAGMSGVAAARTLYDRGVTSFVILEASDKVGGRITSANIGGVKGEQAFNFLFGVDLAETGRYKTNPIWSLVQATKFSFTALNDLDAAYNASTGRDITTDYNSVNNRFNDIFTNATNICAERKARGQSDISFRELLNISGWFPITTLERFIDRSSAYFSYGAPAENVSAFAAVEDNTYTDYGSDSVFLTDNRSAQFLVQYLGEPFLKPNILHVNTTVSSIEYGADCVCANVLENGQEGRYCGRYGIITFPIGVLQSGKVSFSPSLPQWKLDAIGQFGYIYYMQIFILFNETFWNESFTRYFLVSNDPSAYWKIRPIGGFYPTKPHLLLIYAIGPLVDKILGQNVDQTKQDIMNALRAIYGNFRAQIVDISIPDRKLYDKYGFFGLTFPKVGRTPGTFANLSAPLGNLYFSGVATNEYYPEYVHGAYDSGLRTANAILNKIAPPTAVTTSGANGSVIQAPLVSVLLVFVTTLLK